MGCQARPSPPSCPVRGRSPCRRSAPRPSQWRPAAKTRWARRRGALATGGSGPGSAARVLTALAAGAALAGTGGIGRRKSGTLRGFVGNSTLAGPRANDHEAPARKRLGCGPTLATNPQPRRGEVWQAPGFQRPQPSPVLSEGGETVRTLHGALSPQAEPMVDWCHGTMKLTGLAPEAQGRVPDDQPLGEAIRARLERRQGSLWHGNLTQALPQSAAMAAALAHVAAASPKGQAGAHGVQGAAPPLRITATSSQSMGSAIAVAKRLPQELGRPPSTRW